MLAVVIAGDCAMTLAFHVLHVLPQYEKYTLKTFLHGRV